MTKSVVNCQKLAQENIGRPAVADDMMEGPEEHVIARGERNEVCPE